MPLQQWIGFLGLLAVAACWSLAVVVYRAGVAGSTARTLGILLAVEGIALVSAGFPEFASGLSVEFWNSYFESHPRALLLASLIHHGADAAMIALYPYFLALALNTKLTRPFRDTRVRIALAGGALPLGLVAGISMSPTSLTLLYSTVTLLFVFALVASIDAWITAKRGIERKRAGLFSVAFGIRDIGWGLSYAIFAWLMWGGADMGTMTPSAWLAKIVYAAGTLFAVPLIAYGILRTQLFDIDLRIQWTIKQSTVAAVFVAIFYLVSEGADRLLSSELGNVFGLLASALVMFFLAPLQRFADRVAGAAMPNTENTSEYAAFRKLQVYEAALAEALPDGRISARERDLLNRLRDSLGIAEADARAIERELQKSWEVTA